MPNLTAEPRAGVRMGSASLGEVDRGGVAAPAGVDSCCDEIDSWLRLNEEGA